MKSKIVVLLVMAQDGRGQLIQQLEASGIDFLLANDCSEAREILETQHSVQVVVADVTLPDGDWGSVLEMVQHSPLNAEVLVCAGLRSAGLWCEILQRGAYDVLVEPYQREEVFRILNGAVARSPQPHALPVGQASWVEIKNPAYSQAEGRGELVESFV